MILHNIFTLATTFYNNIIPIISAIIALGILITVHEFGHFLFCKLFGIHTPTFSIGFGPTIINKLFGKTNFQLALIPLGGYVEIAGMDEPGQGKQKHAQSKTSDSFATKAWWKKAFVISGGIIGNLLFAYIIFTGLIQQGFVKQWCTSTRIAQIEENSNASKQGLKTGDTIIKINNQDTKDSPQKIYQSLTAAKKENAQSVIVTYTHGTETKETEVLLSKKEEPSNNAAAQLCIILEQNKTSVTNAAIKAAYAITSISKLIIKSMIKIFSQRDASAVSGPVGIIQTTTKAAQEGLSFFFFFVAIISINLAVFNLLPLPILDGGQLLIVTLESLSGRSLSQNARGIIANLCWLLFLVLIIFATYQDIRKIIGW